MKSDINRFSRKDLLSALARYGLALASTGLAALVRLLLPWVLAPAPYLGFYPAVVVSAALGGVGPGLVATFASLFLVNFVFGRFNLSDHGAMARQLVWVTASIGVSLLAGMQRTARMRERRQAAQLSTVNEALRLEIAERQAAEVALRRAKEEWERTFDSVPDLIATIDSSHRVMRVNRAMANRLGVEPEACVGLACYEVIHGTSLPPAFCPHAKTIEDSQPHAEEVHIERFGGDFLVTTTPLLDEKGHHVGSVHIARDITERKRNDEALKRLNDELELRVAERTAELRDKDRILLLQSRQAAMGEMIGNIAHQWRQPLNTLGLTIQQMELYYDLGEFTGEFLENSARSSMNLIRHMSQTIDDFRNYFRPDKEKVEFRVSESITSTLQLMEDSFKNQQVSIEVVTHADPVVFGYPNEFAQVLLNILINAKDALTENNIGDPRVTLVLRSEGGHAVLTVTDNAGGIPGDIIDKVFDPYFTTKGPQQGTGVGLFMSKTIIEKNMSGQLTVSNVGDGAEFRIVV
jgi:PAS domain S-box-containing protein